MAITQVLGIASVGRVAAFVVPLAALVATGGFFSGREWEQGRQAQRELRAQEIVDADEQTEVERLRAIAQSFEETLARQRAREQRAQAELDSYLADRPGLSECGLDADGLSLWRSWSEPASAAGESDAAVPEDPAGPG